MKRNAIKCDRRTNFVSLVETVKPCTITYTLNSAFIESKSGNYHYLSRGNFLRPKEVSYIAAFRKYFQKNGDKIEYDKSFLNWKRETIKYYIKRGRQYDDIVEVDINHAYPTAGKLLGIIPEALYEKGRNLGKHALLVSIGSLYRRRVKVKVYASGKRKLIEKEERVGYMSDIWTSIVNMVDCCVQGACKKAKGDVLFYYVDAIFVRERSAEKIIAELGKMGFACKKIKIDKVEYRDNIIIANSREKGDRTYTMPKRRKTTMEEIESVMYKPGNTIWDKVKNMVQEREVAMKNVNVIENDSER